MKKKEYESKIEGSEKTKAAMKGLGKFDPKRALRGAIDAVRLLSKLSAHAQKDVQDLVDLKLKTMKLLFEAEEKERSIMANEEKMMRKYDLIVAKEVERPYVEEQRLFEREFTRLIQIIHEPPQIVTRLRFQMGLPTSGGGIRIITTDPATKKELDVVSMPIMYEDDEEELSRHVLEMLGAPHRNLVNIVDYSIHQVLAFNFNGSASTNERIALVVVNHPKGEPLSNYMAENWMLMTDNDFRLILLQIARSLTMLHK